ncbi:MAG: type II toxin-antitoxin system Phd/YefM family antitoxin [Leptolyngbyaceae cyanobacterium CSU_1_4]|nr:type II toxin-antitoxin system Phd/YefM family antitoxin [Leptolyngbyaceae cyanobacterium CSU_1_4]
MELKSDFTTMSINLDNILSLTDFKRNASQYIEQVTTTHSPLVLTVNGRAEVIVHDAKVFQKMLDKIQRMEQELESLRHEELRRAVEVGIGEAARGEVDLLDIDMIKQEGRQLLAKQTK